eukprot:6683584-Lingulodinium_polyedra.AAC.1
MALFKPHSLGWASWRACLHHSYCAVRAARPLPAVDSGGKLGGYSFRAASVAAWIWRSCSRV